VKISSGTAMLLKTHAAPKNIGATSSKAAPAKSVPRDNVVAGASVLPKFGAPSKAIISKTMVTVTASKVGVLRISAGTKRSSVAPSHAAKGKHVRVDAMPPLAVLGVPLFRWRSF
jgi:hypothetical protein